MGALPRPDLAPGPARELNDALHELHHRAGWPSLRTLAHDAGCSHTTVSHVFSSPKLPTWGVIELLVEAMHGTPASFHDLWLAASTPRPSGTSPTPRIAGRRSELTAVRRHLESGTGLLLVTGEAGIGKTKLVTTAAAGADAFVATGTCRPLSSEVPLLPFSDLFHQILHADRGWFQTALDAAPDYVAEALSQLLPEVGTAGPSGLSEEWARQRLFHAITALLAALHARAPLGLLVEDAHWADHTSLDLLELLAAQPTPMVITWRADDPDVPVQLTDWIARLRRLPKADTLLLGPLTPEETAEQLTLLGGQARTPEEAHRIHARSLGQPLFTEQLALHPDDRPLPELLAELLQRRMRTLSPDGWRVARALGVANRPLQADQLAGIVTVDPVPGLRELAAQRLLGPSSGGDVTLRHPLVADAIRARMAPGEAPDVHRAVALMLSVQPDAQAAEIAGHWAGAGDLIAELPWRIEAARAASARFAVESAASQWRRVYDLWPDDLREVGDPPLSRECMFLTALEAIQRWDYAASIPLIDRARDFAADATPADAAAIEMHLGDARHWLGDQEGSLELSARAVAMYEPLPPSRGQVTALRSLSGAFEALGRFREAAEVTSLSVAAARRNGNSVDLKRSLAQRAWDQSRVGDRAGARATVAELAAIELDPPDPYCELHVAVNVTDTLLMAGAPADDLVSVARRALDDADEWGLHQWADAILRANVSEALLNQGDTRRAWHLVGPLTEGDQVVARYPLYEVRARLEMLAGRTDEALRCIGVAAEGPGARGGLAFRLEHNHVAATIELCVGRADAALQRSLSVLESCQDAEDPAMLAPLLGLAARATADLRDRPRRARLLALHKSLMGDPFAPHPLRVDTVAHGAAWTAELARLDGAETPALWTTAITAWDTLRRPHDSAYCRWRAAQVARATGQASLADKLLRRAARDAREHVPLSRAIAGTA